ncbi:hypothetical protein BD779DRAFT_1476871 [Infundibulicybe gibba]|nr:hypothetical protein BD779DRAFT_1476871 [Infundibulicybe gibba]
MTNSEAPAPLRLHDTLKETIQSTYRVEQKLRQTQKFLKSANRLSAITYNRSWGSELNQFEVVLFSDLRDPQEEGLPPLTSREAVAKLTAAQRRAYYKGYYPDGRDRCGDQLDKIYEAIGVRRKTSRRRA